ncbi:MAG: alpha/beta hydrolase-fold protein [Opitutus sp.]
MKLCVAFVSVLLGLSASSFAQPAPAADASTLPPKPRSYPLSPEAVAKDGVPHGKLEGPYELKSQIIPHTVRRYWIFVPAQYSAESPANLLVFHDGQRALNPKGPLRVDVVLENMIHQKNIPVTIGVFVTPGNSSDVYPDNLGMSNPNHRAQEYDAMNDDYTRMLLTELLPEVTKKYKVSDDPERRAIGGTSSGGIAAFTVAWNRPDQFRNVLSMIGSFTSIGYRPAKDGAPMLPGGDLYPTLIRKTPIKPLKVFLQDGSNDLSNAHGNWFLANQQMLSALEFANANADLRKVEGPRYRINHVWGEGGHSDDHGGSVLPDMLRWIWGSTAQ